MPRWFGSVVYQFEFIVLYYFKESPGFLVKLVIVPVFEFGVKVSTQNEVVIRIFIL